METLKEDADDSNIPSYVKRPKLYKLYSLSECVAAAHELDLSEEGYVVVDKNFNRIKIKGDAYLQAHKMRSNGVVTVKNIVELWQNDQIDDFLAVYPEHAEFVEDVMSNIRSLINEADFLYVIASKFANDRKSFAKFVNRYHPMVRGYLFARLDNKYDSAIQYYKSMRIASLVTFILPSIKEKFTGIVEDDS